MIEILSTLALAFATAGLAIGVVRLVRDLRSKPTPEVRDVCGGCHHHRSFHSGGKRGCYASQNFLSCNCMIFVPAHRQQQPLEAKTPAQLAKLKGYDADYVAFLEWLQHTDKASREGEGKK